MTNAEAVKTALAKGPATAIGVAVWCRAHDKPAMTESLAGTLLTSLARQRAVRQDGEVWSLTPEGRQGLPAVAPATPAAPSPVEAKKGKRMNWGPIVANIMQTPLGVDTRVAVPDGKEPEAYARKIYSALNNNEKGFSWSVQPDAGSVIVRRLVKGAGRVHREESPLVAKLWKLRGAKLAEIKALEAEVKGLDRAITLVRGLKDSAELVVAELVKLAAPEPEVKQPPLSSGTATCT